MKRLKLTLFVFLFLSFGKEAFSQPGALAAAAGKVAAATGLTPPTIVHDPTAAAKLVAMLDEARKTYQVVEKELELLEKAKEQLSKVNGFVRTVRYVDDIKSIQQDIYRINQESLHQAQRLHVINKEGVIALVELMNNSLTSLESTLNLASHLLEDDLINLSDGERLEQLAEIRNECYQYRATANYLNREIRRFAQGYYLNEMYRNAAPSIYYNNR